MPAAAAQSRRMASAIYHYLGIHMIVLVLAAERDMPQLRARSSCCRHSIVVVDAASGRNVDPRYVARPLLLEGRRLLSG